MERARALQHRAGRRLQAPARQARDDPRGPAGHRARADVGRAPGRRPPLRQRAEGARRGAGRPRGDAAAAHARDRRGVPRRLRLGGDPAVDVDALRRRRHPPPRDRLPGQGARHQRRQRRARRRLARRRRDRPRPRAARRARARLRAGRHVARRPGPALLHERHDRPGQGHPARASLPARPRGVRLLPRGAGRRALPRHGRVGLGRGHLAAARAVALRRRPGRPPARGRVQPEQAARLPLAPRGHERLHHADGDALDDGHRERRRAVPAEVPPRVLGRASRSTPRRSAGSASSTG